MEQTPKEVGPPLVADSQAAAAQEPGERALDHPPVPAQPLARLDAAAGDPGGDAAPAEGPPQRRESYPLSPWSLAGRLRGRPGLPRGPMMDGIASTRGSNWVESWALAADRRTAARSSAER